MRFGVVLLFALLLPQSAAPEPRPITLEEALRLAESSPSGRAVALEVERARAAVGATGLWPNPGFSLDREQTFGFIERFITVSIPIPISGRRGLEKEAARSGATAAEARARQERISLRARVREAFLDLLASQDRLAALDFGLARIEELVGILSAREREGESSGYDRIRAERERAEVTAERLDSRAILARSRSQLAAFLDAPWEASELVAEGSLLGTEELPSKEDVLSRARSRGDLLALDAEAARADALARAAGRLAIPQPSFVGGTKTIDEAPSSGTGPVLGINFDIPLFDRGQGEVAIARAEEQLLLTLRAALGRLIEAEVESAFEEVVARREAEEVYRTSGDPEALVRIARAAYEEGEMGILELLDAHRTDLEARILAIELRLEARKAEAALMRAMGGDNLSPGRP
jgi:cobalt-zinc-cadmium efflux system outer membrane protein